MPSSCAVIGPHEISLSLCYVAFASCYYSTARWPACVRLMACLKPPAAYTSWLSEY